MKTVNFSNFGESNIYLHNQLRRKVQVLSILAEANVYFRNQLQKRGASFADFGNIIVYVHNQLQKKKRETIYFQFIQSVF